MNHKSRLNPEDFLTPQGGQVSLTPQAVKTILKEHGIVRVLAAEGGRTSRGNIKRMREYISFLNQLKDEHLFDAAEVEKWWIDKVRSFFASQPLRLKIDASMSLRYVVRELLDAAFRRQRQVQGSTVAGAVMQHLVGAKLEIALPKVNIEHRGFSAADAPGRRKGDFLVGDAVLHVSTAPTEMLMRKCADNVEQNFRPVIVTTERGAAGAAALAADANLLDRIDVFEIEQFVATNVYELSGFTHRERPLTVRELVDRYNKIVEACETDPSLRISVD